MNTGKLNRRITIVTPGAMTPDGIGGFTEGVKSSRVTWCSAKQLSMAESLSYGLETATASYRFSFQYFSADDITRVKELTYSGRTFRIVNVENVNESNKQITVIANERLGSNSNPSPPPEIPDGAITTMNGAMIILSSGGDYVLTVNGFVPLNALTMPDG